MKALIIILLFSINPLIVFSNTTPDSIKYNYAFSGLKLRTGPSTQATMISVIPFGESITVLESSNQPQRIEWLEGSWIKVDYQGQQGFVFDGFISSMRLPSHTFEMTQEDLDLSSPLAGWVRYNFETDGVADILEKDNFYQESQSFEQGFKLIHSTNTFNYNLMVHFPNKSLTEVYNLIKAMLMTKQEREIFTNNSLFILGTDNKIKTIKIKLESPIIIQSNPQGIVTVKVTKPHESCVSF